MAEPGDRTPEQDDAARIADTRRAMELGLPPARGTTAPGHGRPADTGRTADGVRSLDDQRELRGERPPEHRGTAGPDEGRSSGAGAAAGGSAAGGGAAGGGAAAGGAAPGAAAAGPPSRKALDAAEKVGDALRAENDARTAEEIWKASEPSTHGAAPEHRRRPGQGRPPNQQTDRGPGNRGPSR